MRWAARHLEAVLGAAAFAVVLAAPCDARGQARVHGSAEARVSVRVVPSLTVSLPGEGAAGGHLHAAESGAIVGVIPFRASSNTAGVRFQLGATALYKGADPNAVSVIPVETVEPARLVASSSGGAPSAEHVLAWTAATFLSHGLRGHFTTQAAVEGISAEVMRLDVNVMVRWRGPVASPAAGSYSGYVKLIAEIILP